MRLRPDTRSSQQLYRLPASLQRQQPNRRPFWGRGPKTQTCRGRGPETNKPETTGCTPTGPERCFNATDDNCNGIVDEGCGISTGLLQFVVAWDKPAADVDLEVTDPNGELAEVERASESGLVKEHDCPGQNNECQGQNLENVYLEGTEVTRGSYRVRVRLEKLGSEDPPVEVRLGARVGPKTYRARLVLAAAGDERVLVFQL